MPEMVIIRHLVGSDVNYDRVSGRNGVRAEACGGPLRRGIKESILSKLSEYYLSLSTFTCGPPCGEASARTALASLGHSAYAGKRI